MLDRNADHPEIYHIADAMAKDMKCSVLDFLQDENLRGRIYLTKYKIYKNLIGAYPFSMIS
ncbi:hypothetical protein [Candidatus Brocadia sapporoensis]|uniref:hypothetical protein n=1 Tax=Candidatus Brocadia sapporoensis TaxID=392547 RepID=UPI003B967F45